MLAGLFLCIGGTASAAAESTLIYCSEASPEGFNPAFHTSLTTWDASAKPIFNRLVEFEPGSLNLVPALAESWKISDDGLTYTFTLRRNVRFHDAPHFTHQRMMNADDVIFSVERQRDRDHPFHRVGSGTWAMFESLGMGDIIERVEALDQHTVRFHLRHAAAPFLANLAMDFMSIQSAAYAQAMMAAGTPEKMDLTPLGTGPFQLVRYDRDAVVRYRAYPHYWSGRASVDNLVFSITPDASVRVQKLLAGECHIMAYPNPADIALLRDSSVVTLLEQSGLNIGYLAMHTRKPPLDDVRVRQALSMAINKDAILQSVYGETGTMAINPIPPTLWSWNETVSDYPHDPDAARALLDQAGMPDGFKTNIWAMPVQRPYNPNARRMAELIQADWAAIGVQATIVTYEWGEYLKRSRNGEHQTVLLGWSGQNGDPDNFLYTLLSCDSVHEANRSRWCHHGFNELIHTARSTADVAARTTLYRRAQEIFKQQAPWVTIAHSRVFVPVRREVRGYRMDPLGGHSFYGVELTTAAQ